jgi:hypothetical protein
VVLLSSESVRLARGFLYAQKARLIISKKPQKQLMYISEIGIFIFLILITLQVIQNMNRIKNIEWRMTQKMDKPLEPSDWDKWREERAKKPLLTKEELDKVMSPEEKAYWKKTNGTGYPNGVK